PTGDVTFTLYANSTCTTGTGVSGTGGISNNSASFSTTWTAPRSEERRVGDKYAGEANNNRLTNTCNEANEQRTVIKASPSITTTASPTSIVVGTPSTVGDTAIFHDTTTTLPTGDVTFTLYSDNTCKTGTGVSGTGAISNNSASFSTTWTAP